jgi:hypothetical protein
MRVRTVIVSLAAVLLSLPLALVAPSAAFADRPLVDPSTLNPPPHDTGKPVCAREGNFIVCHTTIDINSDLGTFDSGINCAGAELQWSMHYTLRAGSLAIYDASGDVLRLVYDDSYTGSFSNPDNGKSVAWTQHDRTGYVFTTPGDNTTGTMTMTELQQVRGSTGRVILTDAGTEVFSLQDGTRLKAAGHHPLDDYLYGGGSTTGLAPLCNALT